MSDRVRRAGRDGHGAARRGRSSSEDREGVAAAMRRLLALGGVRAESRWAEAGGVRLHYLEAGAGPAVVLLHGAGGGAANWYRLMGPLAARFRVLAPDLPGFGLTPAVPIEAPLGESGAELVRAWVNALGLDRFSLVGTSFGGLLALRLAQRAPAHVERLALLNAVGLGRAVPLALRLAAFPFLGSAALRPSRRGTEWLLRSLLVRDGRTLEPEHRRALVDYLWRSSAAGDPAGMARSLRFFCGATGQRERFGFDELASIVPPVLLAWGARDRFLPPRHGRRAAARIPRSVLWLVPGAGHSPNWEAPGQVLRVLVPFLAGGTAAAA